MKRDDKDKAAKTCHKCKKEIYLDSQHYVLIGTYNKPIKLDDEVYFHFQCWENYFNESVLAKAKQQIKFMQEKVKSLLENPMISSLLESVKGSGQLVNMMNLPLEAQKPKKDIKGTRKTDDERKKSGKNDMPKV